MARIFALVCLLLLTAGPRHAAAADSFWLPLPDGTVFSFMVSGQVLKSTGENYGFGPALEQTVLTAVDRPVLDHHADLASTNGWFLQRTAAGWFRVADGDPDLGGEYDYYIDPEPFLLEAPMDVGQVISFAGLRRGQWDVPGGGTEAWSGTWSVSFTHLGHAPITTPLGSFDAALLQVHSADTVDKRALFPDASGRSHWTETWWFVPGRGIVQVQGSGLFESDFNGDGIADYWSQESQLMVAVPEPAAPLLLAAGLLLGAAWRRRCGMIAACPPSATPPR